jgi:hypothetical protein
MRADIGGNAPVILHLRQKRARGRLFSTSGRHMVIAIVAIVALLAGLGVVTERMISASPAPFAWIGR